MSAGPTTRRRVAFKVGSKAARGACEIMDVTVLCRHVKASLPPRVQQLCTSAAGETENDEDGVAVLAIAPPTAPVPSQCPNRSESLKFLGELPAALS